MEIVIETTTITYEMMIVIEMAMTTKMMTLQVHMSNVNLMTSVWEFFVRCFEETWGFQTQLLCVVPPLDTSYLPVLRNFL